MEKVYLVRRYGDGGRIVLRFPSDEDPHWYYFSRRDGKFLDGVPASFPSLDWQGVVQYVLQHTTFSGTRIPVYIHDPQRMGQEVWVVRLQRYKEVILPWYDYDAEEMRPTPFVLDVGELSSLDGEKRFPIMVAWCWGDAIDGVLFPTAPQLEGWGHNVVGDGVREWKRYAPEAPFCIMVAPPMEEEPGEEWQVSPGDEVRIIDEHFRLGEEEYILLQGAFEEDGNGFLALKQGDTITYIWRVSDDREGRSV